MQDIANKYGITRERVRQIIFIAINNLKSMIIIENFVPSIKIYTSDINNINYDEARKREKEVRHDVMSHVYAYGLQCPNAKGIIHLGATSCYVGDNTDIIIMRDALVLIKKKLITVLNHLSNFAMKYKDMPTLGFTHFQPAQLTTVGKRATLWMQDLVIDIENIDFVLAKLKLRGVKGTTGTQASFMNLFEGDEEKIKSLETVQKYLEGKEIVKVIYVPLRIVNIIIK